MAQFTLYIDTDAGSLVSGPENPNSAALPKLIQGDTPSFRIYLLARTSTFPQISPYNVVDLSSLSLKVALTDPGGSSSTVYTNQYTWAKDGTNSYFYADLPLNTAPIATLLGSGKTASLYFEVEYTQSAVPTTVLLQSTTIFADGIKAGSTVVPAGETALSAEVANATFLKNTNNGFTLTNPTTGHQAFVYLGDDDTLHCDPIT